jgi:hypothetical protein
MLSSEFVPAAATGCTDRGQDDRLLRVNALSKKVPLHKIEAACGVGGIPLRMVNGGY